MNEFNAQFLKNAAASVPAVFKRDDRDHDAFAFTRINMFSQDEIQTFAQQKGFRLKEIQLLSIENVLNNRDTVVIAKTGEGKSLIFQVATSMLNTKRIGITIVVSPLVALMQDQARAAAPWGTAVFLGSAQEDKQAECHLQSYNFIFMAPEKLQQANIQRELKRIASMIFLIVIDEAHTQVTWQGFRPAFAAIPAVLQNIFSDQRPTFLMMTATLTSDQQVQLSVDFNLSDDTKIFRASCDRDNLSIQITNTSDKIEQLLQYARASKRKGNLCLIFLATPMECQSLGNSLKDADQHSDSENKLRVRLYHGAGSTGKFPISDDRTETLRIATEKQLDVCICTSAFGMGVDIPNIDTVIHLVPPRSVAEYAQHIGRAGRDGNAAVAVMLFHPGNIAKCFSLWVADKNVQTMNQNFRDVQNMMSFIYSSQCRRKFVRKILENIEDNVPLHGNCNCDTCEETHIIQRDIGPAMRLLLSAIREHTSPVCITRISDTLFAHAPKHFGAWDDTKSPMWGKGKQMFAPTKQSDVWSSLAAVAVYELKFLVTSLHHHLAPPSGHVVAYQRLALTDAGRLFLSSDTEQLLVRERFVAVSSWATIAPRCTFLGCRNKGIRVVGNDFLCSKHASSQSDGQLQQKSTADLSQTTAFISQESEKKSQSEPQMSQESQLPVQCLDHSAQRTLSQLTPQGFLTQMQQGSQCFEQSAQWTMSQPTPAGHLTQMQGQFTTAGTYTIDVTENPDALYNPYMGDTYTSMLANGTKVKVRDDALTCNAVYICHQSHV